MIKNSSTPLFNNQVSLSPIKSLNKKNILYHLQPSTTAIIPYGSYQSSGIGFGVSLPKKVYSMYALTPFLYSILLKIFLFKFFSLNKILL